MREIKFRAWDKLNIKMCLVQRIKFYENEVSALLPKCKTYHSDTLIELMQYTGLKDKNGIEIYDGDIVRDDFDRAMQVVWCPDLEFGNEKIQRKHFARWEFRLLAFSKSKKWTNNFETANFNDWFYPKILIKVIGNIYENPELFKNKAG